MGSLKILTYINYGFIAETSLRVPQYLAGWCNYVVNCILAKPIGVSLTFSMACKASGRILIVLHTHKGKSREENLFPTGRPTSDQAAKWRSCRAVTG